MRPRRDPSPSVAAPTRSQHQPSAASTRALERRPTRPGDGRVDRGEPTGRRARARATGRGAHGRREATRMAGAVSAPRTSASPGRPSGAATRVTARPHAVSATSWAARSQASGGSLGSALARGGHRALAVQRRKRGFETAAQLRQRGPRLRLRVQAGVDARGEALGKVRAVGAKRRERSADLPARCGPASPAPRGSCPPSTRTASGPASRRRLARRRPRPRPAPVPCRRACRPPRRSPSGRTHPSATRSRSPSASPGDRRRRRRARSRSAGLTSRWTTPRSCACASASQTSAPNSATSRSLRSPHSSQLRQGRALDQLADQERAVALRAELVQGHDAGVVEAGGRLRLAQDASRVRAGDLLDRDLALQPLVEGPVDGAHASRARPARGPGTVP